MPFNELVRSARLHQGAHEPCSTTLRGDVVRGQSARARRKGSYNDCN